MDDVNTMATSCPLCLGTDEVGSMVTVEIDRIIPKGKAAIMICRSCTGAVIRAARHADPELLDLVLTEQEQAAIQQAANGPIDDKEEPDDGSSTH